MVSCWCVWQESGFSRRDDVTKFNLVCKKKLCCSSNAICEDNATIMCNSVQHKTVQSRQLRRVILR
jgi:hypothetical protein